MNVQEFRARSDDELKDSLIEMKREQFNLRFQRATGQVENTARVQQLRRDIARVKTVMHERTKEG